MLRLRLIGLLSSVVFASCVEPDSALRVDVKVLPDQSRRVRADCLRLQVLDEAGGELGSVVVPRPADDVAVFAVRRGRFPRTVGVRAQGLIGTCSDEATLKLNAQSDLVTANFPERGFVGVSIELLPPGRALDADGDGFVDEKKGGPDCDDGNITIFPGATQVCALQVDTNCDGDFGCDDVQCTDVPICANPPTKLVLTQPTAPSYEMSRFDCVGPFVFQLQNAAGPRGAIRRTPVTFTSSLPGVSFHQGMNCEEPGVTSLPIPYEGTEVRVWLKASATARGLATITATGFRVPTPGTFTMKVKPLPVAKLIVTSPPRTVTAGVCGADTIDFELQDSQSRHTDADDDAIVIPLSSVNGGGAPVADMLFTDAACGTNAPNLIFAPGTGNASVRVSNQRADVYRLTAVTGSISATQDVTVVPAAPNRLRLLNSFVVLTPGVCSNTGVGVELVDGFGNRAPAPANASLTLVPSPLLQGVTFYSDLDCLEPATLTVPFPAATSERFIPARGMMSTSGTVVLQTDIPSVPPSATLMVSVGVGAVDHIDLSGLPSTITAGGCSMTPLSLVARDVAGNATLAPDAGLLITMNASDPGGDLRFFPSPSCNPDAGRADVFIAPGTANSDVYFSGTRSRAGFSFTGQSAAFPVDGSVGGNVIRAGAPFRMTVDPDAGSTTAGSCTGFQARFLDSYDNLTAFDAGRALGVAPTLLTLAPTGACGDAGVIVPAGSTNVDFFVGAATAGTYAMTATVGALSAGARLVVDAGAPILSVSPTSANVQAGECVELRLSRRDVLNNPTPVGTATNFAVTTAQRTYVYAQAGCAGAVDAGVTMNAGASTADFSVRPLNAIGQDVIIANPAGMGSPQVALDVRAAATSRFAFESANYPDPLTAGVCSPTPVTVRRFDAYDNVVTNGTEPLTLEPTLVRFSTLSSCLDTATATSIADATDSSAPLYVIGYDAGVGLLRASRGAITGSRNITVNPDVPHHLSFTGGSGNTRAGDCAGDVRVELRDRYENRITPVTPVTVALSTDGGVPVDGGSFFFSDMGCGTGVTQVDISSTNVNPRVLFKTARATPPGSPMAIFASAPSVVDAGASQAWTVEARDVGALAWKEPAPATVPRFDCVRLGPVETRDVFGNVVSVASTLNLSAPTATVNLGAQFFGSSACSSTMGAPTSVPLGASVSNDYYVVVTGSDAGFASVASSMPTFTTPGLALNVSGAPGALSLSDAGVVEAAGCQPVVVTRVDGEGAPLVKGETSINVTSGNAAALTVHQTADCAGDTASFNTTFAPGQSTATFYVRGRSAETPTQVTVTVTDNLRGSDGGATVATSLPLVRRGRCDLVDVGTTSRCELSPPLPGNDVSRSFLLFSSTGGDNTASNTNVGCRLDASGDAAVLCTRAGDGSPAGDQSLLIEYQVVSYGRNADAGFVSVQHLSGVTGSADVSVPLATAVNPSDSFVLFSSWGEGGENGSDDFMTAHLESGTSLKLLAGPNKSYEAQVVSFAGAQVQRGATGLDAGVYSVSTPTTLAPAEVSRSFLLYSVRGPDGVDGGVSEMCKRQVRGNLASTGHVVLSRGAGTSEASCVIDPVQVQWEVVRLPVGNTVQHAATGAVINGNGSGGTLTTDVSFTAVTRHRAVSFLGGQGPGGQTGGESSFFAIDEDTTGPFHALTRFLSDTSVRLECRNPGPGREARFSPMVVQFAP